MIKFVHIVYVHPVELGLPNLHKVIREQEFETKRLTCILNHIMRDRMREFRAEQSTTAVSTMLQENWCESKT